MDNPKVSIIVPIYRVEEYIERCAESLFAQTFDDIEYIFVDDCSPDKSGWPGVDDKGFNWPLVITRFIAIAMTGWMCMP